jgi:hypothetical protein
VAYPLNCWRNAHATLRTPWRDRHRLDLANRPRPGSGDAHLGDDANPCSRTAPCKTLGGAYSKTGTNGEITVLDSAGVGGLMITKSINIMARGVDAGVAGTITINAGANDIVKLDGLNFTGFGAGTTGLDVQSARTVLVLNSTFSGYRGAPGVGINVAAPAAVQVSVFNTALVNNTTAIQAGSNATVALSGLYIAGNATGLAMANGGTIISFGNNTLGGNDTDGAPSKTTPLQ